MKMRKLLFMLLILSFVLSACDTLPTKDVEDPNDKEEEVIDDPNDKEEEKENEEEPPVEFNEEAKAAFDTAVETFTMRLTSNGSIRVNSEIMTIIDIEGAEISNRTMIVEKTDINDFYYSISTRSDHSEVPQTTVLEMVNGMLLQYQVGPAIKYEVLSEDASAIDFVTAIADDETMNIDFNSYIINYNQKSDSTFELTVEPDFLTSFGMDINLFIQMLGIDSLDDEEIKVLYTFTSDYTTIALDARIDDIAFETMLGDTETMDLVFSTVSHIGEFEKYSIKDIQGSNLYLPTNKDHIITVQENQLETYVVENGIYYHEVYIDEPGEYEVAVYGNVNYPQVNIYDLDGNKLENSDRFMAEYQGIYLVEIISNAVQNVDIYVRPNPSPEFLDFTFSAVDSTFNNPVKLEGNTWITLQIPESTKNRVLHIYNNASVGPDVESLHINANFDDIYYNESCMLDPNYEEPCYIFLPKDREINLDLNGYFIGNVIFDYEYYEIPEGVLQTEYNWDTITNELMLWLNDDTLETKVNFTITESGNYELHTFYKEFGYSYQDAVLYDASGTQIHYDWEHTEYLEAGDYYIIFKVDYHETVNLMIKAVIEKK